MLPSKRNHKAAAPSGKVLNLPFLTRQIRCLSRRKKQFLVLATVYVVCTLGFVHQNPSLFFSTSPAGSRSMSSINEYNHVDFRYDFSSRRSAVSSFSPPNLRSSDDTDTRQRQNLETGIGAYSQIPSQQPRTATSSRTQTGLKIAHRIFKQIAANKQQKEQPQTGIQTIRHESWEENPLFVLSLPGSGAHSISQYLQCGLAGTSQEIAMYWIPNNSKKEQSTNDYVEIGKCMQHNLQSNRFILDNCGEATVWSSLGYTSTMEQQCYFPNMDITALNAMAKEYPKATFVQVTRDPDDWYYSMSPKWRHAVSSYCGKNHQDMVSVLPSVGASKQDWIDFYSWHQTMVRDFVKDHPDILYVEVSLEDNHAGETLQKRLGISQSCWQPPPAPRRKKPKQLKVPYPIFVASLPKSGTTSTQRYFQCGLNDLDGAAHHWTINTTTGEDMKIGKCMQANIRTQKPLFDNCGNYNVWTDTGFMPAPNQKVVGENKSGDHCFFPTLHENGLQAFYDSYPNGTLMNVVRNASEWYASAMAWRKLPERMSQHCKGFPTSASVGQDWIDFYESHTQKIRTFAQEHPSLTYIEVSLEAPDTPQILQDRIGIPSSCWGKCNPDKRKNKSCGVLRQMREQQVMDEMEDDDSHTDDSVKKRLPTKEQREASARWRTAFSALKKQRRGPQTNRNKTDHRKRLVNAAGDQVRGGRRRTVDWEDVHQKFDQLKNTPVDLSKTKLIPETR